MARVKPRSNIYALMPILATVFMALGIAATWVLGIEKYTGEVDIGPPPAPEVRRFPELPKPAVVEPPAEEKEKIQEGEDEGEIAPDEEEEKAPGGEEEKAPGGEEEEAPGKEEEEEEEK